MELWFEKFGWCLFIKYLGNWGFRPFISRLSSLEIFFYSVLKLTYLISYLLAGILSFAFVS